MLKRVYRCWHNARHIAPPRALLARAARDAAASAGLPAECDWDLELVFTNDRSMAKYHLELVGVPGTTDVITFSYFDAPETFFPGETGVELIINPDAVAREWEKRGTTYAYELMLYLVHGLLHASGEDDLSPSPRRRMRRREHEVMKVLMDKYDLREIFPERV